MNEMEIEEKIQLVQDSITWIGDRTAAITRDVIKRGHSTKEEQAEIEALRIKNRWEGKELKKLMDKL